MKSVELVPARLSDQLCFSLYTASKAVGAVYRPLLAEINLTYSQYLVMLSLWERGEQTVAELGSQVSLDSGTLSPLLRRLEQAGYVTRQRSTRDERAVLVAVTAAGRDLEGAAAEVRTTVEQATGLSTAEFIALRTSLERLTSHLASRN